MAEKEFDNLHAGYAAELRETAEIIDPSDQQCDRILQSVLREAGADGNASYVEAADQVKRLSSLKTVYSITHLLKSRTGFIVIAACLVLVVAVIRLPGQDSGIVTLPDEEIPLASGAVDGRDVAYSIEQPVPDSVNPEALVEGEFPELEGFLLGDNFVKLYFIGNVSDIDWESVYGIDSIGREVTPDQIQADEGWVVFTLPEDDLTVYVSDLAGNRIKMMVLVSN